MNSDIFTIFQNSIRENEIPNELYSEYGVKKGLRNEDGTGVLIGLTRIADVVGYKMENGKKVDDYGELYYRGIPVTQIINNQPADQVNGFEEVCFLILFGHLPTKKELKTFQKHLQDHYNLPEGFLAANILRNPSMNIMNKIQRALLMLYETDLNADDPSVENTFRQGLAIIAKMPAIMCYAYQAKHHILDNGSLIIHQVNARGSIAENILGLLRPDQSYTHEEAKLLDLCLILHADHGAGNNSTFANIVVSSTGTDIYSSFAASVGSLKGPRHGGANSAAKHMMDAVIAEIGYSEDTEQIEEIVNRILDKDFNDNSGLIYGLGHAVYTLSDPRSEILKQKAYEVAAQSNNLEVFEFYKRFEQIAKQCIYKRKGIRVSSNLDFYSGLIYTMLGIPEDLFTPMFVCARTVGWLAHNIENKLYCNRIVRPAGKYVGESNEYTPIEKR